MPRRRKIRDFTDDSLMEIMARHGVDAVDHMIRMVDETTINDVRLPRLIHQVILTTGNDPKAVSKAWSDYLKNLHEIAQYQHPKHRPVETNTKIDANIHITIKHYGGKEDKVIDITPEREALPEPQQDGHNTPLRLEAKEALPATSMDALPG